MATLAHYLAKGTIYNPIGWIRSQAEEAAKTGNYEPVGAATATNQGGKPRTPIYESKGPTKPGNPEKAKAGIQQAKLAARGAL